MSACDTKRKHWQDTPSTYCQCDELDAGYLWGRDAWAQGLKQAAPTGSPQFDYVHSACYTEWVVALQHPWQLWQRCSWCVGMVYSIAVCAVSPYLGGSVLNLGCWRRPVQVSSLW
jgi:hypothetical protein